MTRIGAALFLLLVATCVPAAASDGIARVYPFYSSANPNVQSFLRLINPAGSTATVSLGFYDYATETQQGRTCTIQVAGFAAPQYNSTQLEQCAGVSAPAGASIIAWAEGASNLNLYFEQVLWSPNQGYFTSGSSCSTPGTPYNFAANVHTSSLAGYPATVVLLVTPPVNYQVQAIIYDGATGAVIGNWTSQVQSVQQKVMNIPESQIEAEGNWTVSTKPLHVNLGISVGPAGGGTPFPPDQFQVAGVWAVQSSTGEGVNVATSCKQ